jgi:hypothetical protein
MNPSMQRQIESKAKNSFASQLRNQLHIQGLKVERNFFLVFKDHQDGEPLTKAMAAALGEVKSYVETRQSLSPTVASDMLTLSLQGKYHKYREQISDFTAVPVDDPAADIKAQIKGLKDYQAMCGFSDCRASIDARIQQLESKLEDQK